MNNIMYFILVHSFIHSFIPSTIKQKMNILFNYSPDSIQYYVHFEPILTISSDILKVRDLSQYCATKANNYCAHIRTCNSGKRFHLATFKSQYDQNALF